MLLKEFDAVYDRSNLKPSEDFADWHKSAGYPVLSVKRTNDSLMFNQVSTIELFVHSVVLLTMPAFSTYK